MTAPDLSPAEAEILARFDAAPTLPEAYTPLTALLDQLDAEGDEQISVLDRAAAVPRLTAAVRAVLELANDYDDGSEWGAALFRGDVIRTAIRTAVTAALSVTP